jgi:8-oxo-dGTP pyrophosphatase MutT (NUDIX family)
VKEPDLTIPEEHLPPGFAESIERTLEVVAPTRPAATIVLLRAGSAAAEGTVGVAGSSGVEVLLLRRVRSAGFVPGAWVFPGGRVDGGDAASELVARLDGLGAEAASARLGLAPDSDPPALAYYIAAIREAFEETGILVGKSASGGAPPSAAGDAEARRLRERLLEDEDSFPLLLDQLGCRMDGAAVEYIAHWITPEAEPRRFDTRFFAAAVPSDAESLHHTREMSDAVWISPREALRRHREGSFPMVFPTLTTLAAMEGLPTPAAVLEAFRGQTIPTILPRLVRTPTGIGIRVEGAPPPPSPER